MVVDKKRSECEMKWVFTVGLSERLEDTCKRLCIMSIIAFLCVT